MVNILNIYNHVEDLRQDMWANQSDFVLLTETWINPTYVPTTIHWPERYLTHASIGNGRGVCCYGPKNSADSFISDKIAPNFQILSMLVKNEFQIILVYISQRCNLEEVVLALKDIIIPTLKVVIMGDFNYSVKNTNVVSKFLKEMFFKQHVNHPTHIKAGIIDHIYTSHNIDMIDISYRFNYYSDHCGFNINLTN